VTIDDWPVPGGSADCRKAGLTIRVNDLRLVFGRALILLSVHWADGRRERSAVGGTQSLAGRQL